MLFLIDYWFCPSSVVLQCSLAGVFVPAPLFGVERAQHFWDFVLCSISLSPVLFLPFHLSFPHDVCKSPCGAPLSVGFMGESLYPK